MTLSGDVMPGMWYYLNDDREVVEYTGTYEDLIEGNLETYENGT